LVGFGGKTGKQFPFITFDEKVMSCIAQMPCGMDFSARQFITQFDFAFA
jgi:hypothetical protein